MSTLRNDLSGMDSGDERRYRGEGTSAHVRYDAHQSYGDNNQPVRDAFIGQYTVTPESGAARTFEHGPHATTEAARRKGANPHAKGSAADHAANYVIDAISRARLDNVYSSR